MKRYITTIVIILFCQFSANADNLDKNRMNRESAAFLLAGVKAYNANDLSSARVNFEKALTKDPLNDAAYYYMGHVETASKNFSAALKNFMMASKLDSTNVWYGMRLARFYEMAGKTELALSEYERLLKIRPGDPEMLFSVAELYETTENYAKADSLMNVVERITGPNEYLTVARIELARDQGKYQEFFDRLNNFFHDEDIPMSAKSDYIQKLLKSGDPRFNFAHLDDYTALVQTCLDAHPNDTAAVHFALSYYYAIQKDDKVLELAPLESSDPLTLSYRITICFKQSKYEDVIAACEKLLASSEKQNDIVFAHSLMADSYQALDYPERAYKEYEKVLELDPENIVVMNNYAYYMSCRGKNLGKCEKLSRKVIEKEPENATYLDTYAWILYKQKKYKQAKEYMKKALTFGGKESVEILEHYAAILEALGDIRGAKGYREMAELKKNAGD